MWGPLRGIARAVATCVLLALSAHQFSNAQEPARGVPGGSAPRWFKGNLHTHTLWSDGDDFPEIVVDWYTRHDYHFLALSDHNVLSQGERWMSVDEVDQRADRKAFAQYVRRFGHHWVETRHREGKPEVRLKPLGEFRPLFERPGQFLLIQGEEITDHFEWRPIHLNASNLVDMIPPQGGSTIVQTIENNLRAVREQSERIGQPMIVHLNHPNFEFAVKPEELARAASERFFEVYNGHPATNQLGDASHPGVEKLWDRANVLRLLELKEPPVFGLATDDSHNYSGLAGSSPGRGWIMVRARFLTPEAIIKAISIGDFYASSGVSLRRYFFDPIRRVLQVEVEPQPEAHYTIEFIGTRADVTLPLPELSERPHPTEDTDPPSPIGVVLSSVEGLRARYEFKGDELYVRAVVTSSLAPENPSYTGQKAQAWTQPVGWRLRLPARRPDPLPSSLVNPSVPSPPTPTSP